MSDEKHHGGILSIEPYIDAKVAAKKQWSQRSAGRTRRQPSNCLLHPEQTRDGAVHFPIYDSNSKKVVWPPQQPGPIEPNKASGKGAYPKTNPTLASVSPSTHVCPVFAFRPLLRFAQRPCLPGIHTHAMPVFRPALIPTWRPRFARHLYSPGGHISTGAPFRLTPCPHDARASPGAPCFAWHSHFGRCSASTGARVHPAPIPIWRP